MSFCITSCQYSKCNKSLLTFDYYCKCGKHFCLKHKDPCNHNCDFDYKEHHKKQLNKANPIVMSSKINKI